MSKSKKAVSKADKEYILRKALEAYRHELLLEANNLIQNIDGYSARFISQELNRVFELVDNVESILNEDYQTWDDIPF